MDVYTIAEPCGHGLNAEYDVRLRGVMVWHGGNREAQLFVPDEVLIRAKRKDLGARLVERWLRRVHDYTGRD